MRFVIGLFQPLSCQMRINLRGDQMRVTEEFLDAPQISASIQHMRRVAVTKLVWRKVRIQPGNFQVTFQAQLHETRVQWGSFVSVREKDGRVGRA